MGNKGVFSYNKLIAKTHRLVGRYGVPFHWSRTRNEKFDVHTICVLFVLFEIEQKDYRLFSSWLSITTALNLPNVPHWTTLQKAFKRLPPRLIRGMVRLSGKCRDRIAALDPTYYQLTNPSKGYCRRINRDPRKDALRKASVLVATSSKKVLDVYIKAIERHGMKDVPEIIRPETCADRTILGDKEFDAESFHQAVEDAGGTSIVPPRHMDVPVHRTEGFHRKKLKRTGIPRIFRFRVAAESNNSAVKRRFSPVLRGRTFWQQSRNLYGKYLAYNLSLDCTEQLWNFLQSPQHRKQYIQCFPKIL